MKKVNNRMGSVIFSTSLFCLMLAGSYHANAAADPKVLTVTSMNGGGEKQINVEELRTKFPQLTYNTATPWTRKDDQVEYRGPYLKDVLSSAGIKDFKTLRVTAYDNFNSKILSEEIDAYNPILAVSRKCLPVDVEEGICKTVEDFRSLKMIEKGPIFIVWPLSKLPEMYVPTRNAMWVFFPVLLQAE